MLKGQSQSQSQRGTNKAIKPGSRPARERSAVLQGAPDYTGVRGHCLEVPEGEISCEL